MISPTRRQQLKEDNAAAKAERRLIEGKPAQIDTHPETIRMKEARKKMAYAWRFVQDAIAKGRIKKPSHCKFCRNTEVEAHHLDYDNPLKIVWLCEDHHDVYTAKRCSSTPRRTRAVLSY